MTQKPHRRRRRREVKPRPAKFTVAGFCCNECDGLAACPRCRGNAGGVKSEIYASSAVRLSRILYFGDVLYFLLVTLNGAQALLP